MTKKSRLLSERVETEVLNAAPAQAPAFAEARPLNEQVEKTKIRQKSYIMDLRIHSPATLGYLGIDGLDTAPALVRLARVKGLDVIAVTDFYSGKFIDRVVEAARESTLTVIPGVVIRCVVGKCDDVLLTCLFPEGFSGSGVEEFLKALEVPPSAHGSRNYLVRMDLARILRTVERFEGVALPTRIDKTPFRMSVIPQLVEQYGFRAFDLAYSDSVKYFKSRWPKTKFQLYSFSNANTLAQVGSRVAKIKMPIPGFSGLRQIVGREI